MILEIACFVLIIGGWYIICDQVASSRVVYQFPTGCCSCGLQSNLKLWTLQREWFFADLEIFSLIFPVASREAVIPICEICHRRLEAHKRRNLTIAWMTAALMTVPLAVLIYLLADKYAVCVGSLLGVQFCNIFMSILGGLLGGIILFAILWELTSLLPGLALPARFSLLGKLRFANPDYRQKYKHLNPNPEIPVPQRQMPVGIYYAAVAALLFGIVSDLDTILMGRSRDPSLQIVPINYLLILVKVGLIAMFWRMKKAAFILWIVAIAAEIVLNPSFDINERAEEMVVVAALLLIFLYEWWQTRRSTGQATTSPLY